MSIIIGALFAFYGCNDSNSNSGNLSFEINFDAEDIPVEGGKFELQITSNTNWTVDEDVIWLSVAPRYGHGNETLTITIKENAEQKRSVNLKLSTADKTEYLFIQQSGKSESDYQGNGGNTGFGDISKRIEVPQLDDVKDAQFIAHTTNHQGKAIANFSLEYIKSKKHARWVAFSFYNETAANNVNRTNAWADDPQLAKEHCSQKEDYYGYDRGHIVASADRVYSKEANEQTFYYSNISPMYGDFNQNIWTKFENVVRIWGRSNSFRDTLYVVKGGTLDKVIGYTTTSNYVPIPKYYFMALVNYKDNEYSGVAFWIEHRNDYDESEVLVSDYAITIDDLEQKTGINFFHNLPDDIENSLEQKLDKYKWGGM